jgi:transcriptional regulator with XRE-family HTH domain
MIRKPAELTQRDLGERLHKPQSWVHNCETGNRRLDATEFIAWSEACGIPPQTAFTRFLQVAAQETESSTDQPKPG